MNYTISIIPPHELPILSDICEGLRLPIALTLFGSGTATKSMRDLLGIESKSKRIVIAITGEDETQKLIRAERERLYIDAPGNGIVVAVPIKSVGGGKTLSFLSGGQPVMKAPELNYDYELIIAIANEGCTDVVMDAARAAGARGGTVLHAKGTGNGETDKFFNVSIASEKEIVMIVVKSSEKAQIMSAVLKSAGPGTEAGAIVFSLPVTDVAGFLASASVEEN